MLALRFLVTTPLMFALGASAFAQGTQQTNSQTSITKLYRRFSYAGCNSTEQQPVPKSDWTGCSSGHISKPEPQQQSDQYSLKIRSSADT